MFVVFASNKTGTAKDKHDLKRKALTELGNQIRAETITGRRRGQVATGRRPATFTVPPSESVESRLYGCSGAGTQRTHSLLLQNSMVRGLLRDPGSDSGKRERQDGGASGVWATGMASLAGTGCAGGTRRPNKDGNHYVWLPPVIFFLKEFLYFCYLFIYLFLAVLGLCFCARAFSSCGKRGPLFITVRGPLTIAASVVAEHRLQTRRLSNCGSRA